MDAVLKRENLFTINPIKMKNKLRLIITAVTLLAYPSINFAQAPSLGTCSQFVLFSTNGAVSNSGISQLTGNVGTNNGSNTFFGNVNGGMHASDSVSAQCSSDLLNLYNKLDSSIANYFPSSLLGNGDTLVAGVYSISAAATLNSNLILNAQGNANAVFIFQIQGSFSSSAASKVVLINGAMACNVFWKIEGLVSLASGTTMRGTIVANNAAIIISSGDTLEGRALSTAGAVSVDGLFAYTPIGCGSPTLNGPIAPTLIATSSYGLFSSNGSVTNSGITHVTGDVGTNIGLTTGFDSLLVIGTIHPIPDTSTSACASNLTTVYNYLNLLPYDIELLYPAQFGGNLVLTPHTYVMNAATILTDTLYLNGLGNANAVFVIQINGAFSTSTYSKILLINGTQAKNVFWKITGAVSVNDYSLFNGTIICSGGAINLNIGVTLNGRAMTTVGNLTTSAITVNVPSSLPSVLTITGTTPASICGSGIATLGATASAGIINWYANITGGISLGTGGTFTTPIIFVNDTLYVDATLAGNTTSSRTAVIATVKTVPVITGTTPNAICGFGVVSLSAIASVGTINWYANKLGGLSLGTGPVFTTPILTMNDTMYIDATLGNCTTLNRTAVIATVNTIPTITGTTPGSNCGSGQVTLGALSSAGTINWYANLTGGTSLATGVIYVTPTISVNDTLYVDATHLNCKSISRTAVLATIKAIPTITGTTPGSVKGSGTVLLSATSSAGTINWYANSIGGSSLATGITYTTPVISANDTLYVDATFLSCTTLSRTSVIASVTSNTGIASLNDVNKALSIYPNPFSTSLNIILNDASQINNYELMMYTILGKEIMHKVITDQTTILETNELPSGVYFYKVIANNSTIQSGKLIAQ